MNGVKAINSVTQSKGILNVFVNMSFQWIFDFKACKIAFGNEYGSPSGIILHLKSGAQPIFFFKSGLIPDASIGGLKNLKITSIFFLDQYEDYCLYFDLILFEVALYLDKNLLYYTLYHHQL